MTHDEPTASTHDGSRSGEVASEVHTDRHATAFVRRMAADRTVLDTGEYVPAEEIATVELVDGLVWEAVGNVTSDNQVYHTGDCGRLPSTVRSADRERVIAWDRSECAYCAGTHSQHEGDE